MAAREHPRFKFPSCHRHFFKENKWWCRHCREEAQRQVDRLYDDYVKYVEREFHFRKLQSKYNALHVRCLMAEGHAIVNEGTVNMVREHFSLYEGPPGREIDVCEETPTQDGPEAECCEKHRRMWFTGTLPD